MRALLVSCLCFSLVAVESQDNRTFKEIEYKDGGFRYNMPLLVQKDDGNETAITSSLSRVLDFYNTEKLRRSLQTFRKRLSPDCRRDVDKYVAGLDGAENWALKMDDASGRYSTGWFWGNHYWTGSQSLCENLAPKNIVITQHAQAGSKESRKSIKSPSQAAGYRPGKFIYTSVPSFPVSFFILRIHLNTTFTAEEKQIFAGYCLPEVCSHEDVKTIIEGSSKSHLQLSVRVEDVKSRHNYYDIWKDTTFRILCVVSSLVVLLLLIGTTYDYVLEKKKNNKHILSLNCTTYINKQTCVAGNSTLQLDASLPEYDTTNDNGNTYVVNELERKSDLSGDNPAQKCVTFLFLKSITKDILLAFSLRLNLKTICDQSVGSDTIPVIHGLKSISMAWVILGHTCIIAFKYSDNMEYRRVVQQEVLFQTIANGAFSVDTFFFTSGLLVSFLYFRTNAKGKLDSLSKGRNMFSAGALHFIGLVVYRFARLTIPYLFVIGVVEVSMKWFNYNSIFEPPTMDHVNCHEYWWRNILYINTLFPVEQMCMLWSWYLSNDTQFYIIGAILLILATRHFKSAAALLIIFMMSSWLTTGYIAYSNSHIPNSDDPMALFDKIYDKPWTRLGPYFIGMISGWILYRTDCSIRMPKSLVFVGWTTSICCLLSLIYGLYEAELSPITGAAYSSLSHSAWALGLAWIAIACSTGYGGVVNTVLSSPSLYPLSRVTYCAYLLHPILIRTMTMSMDSPLHLGGFVVIIIFMGQVVASYMLSFVISLAFEAPVVAMLRILSRLAPSSEMNKVTP